MTRIVAGVAGGRRLAVPRGRLTRPTSDRAREAMFSTVAALVYLPGAHVLDLYAGSGALGLEALSRGAAHALLVEADQRAIASLRANIEVLALPGAVAHVGAVERVTASAPDRIAGAAAPYELAFADPPYLLAQRDLADVLVGLTHNGWLAPGALLVVERSARGDTWAWPTPLEPIRDRHYGEASLWYGRAP